MALLALGTNANNSLSAIQWYPGMSQADFAELAALIGAANEGSGDNPVPAVQPFNIDQAGHLYLPGRDAPIQLIPGDYIALDTTTGWPIVLSENAVTNGPYTAA